MSSNTPGLVLFKALGAAVVGVLLAGLILGGGSGGSLDAAEALDPSNDPANYDDAKYAKAIFAGGCFWCMEPPYDKLDGVVATISGYTAGPEENPTYKEVSAGKTGHTEAVMVVYEADTISYDELLEVFWRNIDPTVANRQFCDWGSQYRTGIYPIGDEQQKLAEASKQALVESKRFPQVVTEVESATPFYPAEEYHQNFYKKNPGHYKRYRSGCGRDARLRELWGE